MKKISVISSIFCIILFFAHCTVACLHYSGVISGRMINIILGMLLLIPFMIHMFSSLASMIKYSQKDSNADVYPALNKNIIIQSATGIFAVIFLVLHVIVNLLNNAYEYKILFAAHAILEFLFVLFILVHLLIGFPKLLLSLGFIKNNKWYEWSKRITFLFLIFPSIMYMISSVQYHFIYANF